MKKLIIVLFVVSLIACLSGCYCQCDCRDEQSTTTSDKSSENTTSTEEGSSMTTKQNNNPYWEYFDNDKEHKPSENDVLKIEVGMSFAEVIEKIGKPHEGGPLSGPPSFLWETDNGKLYYLVILRETLEPQEGNIMEILMKYGRVAQEPVEW